MGQLCQDSGTIILGYTREDSYIMAQQTKWLHWETVVRTTMSGHSTWENYTKTLYAQLHQTQLTGQLNQDTVDRTITLQQSKQDVNLGHSKRDSYVMAHYLGQ